MWMTQGSGNVDDSDPEFKATLIVNLSTIECENWMWILLSKLGGKVLMLAKVEKSSGTNSTAKENPVDAS